MKKKLQNLSVLHLFFTGLIPLLPSPAFCSETEFLISSSLKMIWGLLIVLGILLIIYGLARKKLTFIQSGGRGAIKILETRHLMPKKTLFLVEVEGSRYLLGGGADTLSLISRVDPAEPKPSFNEILDNSGEETTA